MARNRKYQHRSRETVEGFIPIGNEAFSQAMLEKARGNSARKHLSTKHKGSRKDRKRQAIRDQKRNG